MYHTIPLQKWQASKKKRNSQIKTETRGDSAGMKAELQTRSRIIRQIFLCILKHPGKQFLRLF